MADGMTYQEAAKAVGMTTRGMRMALERPAVIQFLKAQRQVLRAAMSGQNLAALARVRDANSNLATVRAVQAIEALDADQGQLGAAAPVTPGLVIIVASSGAPLHKPPITIEDEKPSNGGLDDDVQEPRALMPIKR
jgi:hypothetical protein